MSEVAVKALPRRGRLWVILVLGLGLFALGYWIVNISTQKAAHNVVHIAGIAEAQEIFGGVPQEGPRLGSSDAPVTVQVFNDLQCSSCREAFLEAIPKLTETYAREAEVKFLYHHYSVAENALEAGFFGAEAAARQGYGWQYIYLFFRNQEEAKRFGLDQESAKRFGLEHDFLESVAGGIEELNFPEWKEDLETDEEANSAVSKQLEAEEKLGTELGIRSEGAMIVSGPGGTTTLQDGPDLAEVEAAIHEAQD